MSSIVITGASGGIGAELARQLGEQGHQLTLGARRLEELEAVAATIAAPTLCVRADVTRRADVEALRDAALERFGAIDVWVNNAGRGIATLALIADVNRCHLREVAFFGDFAPHPKRGKVGEFNQCK